MKNTFFAALIVGLFSLTNAFAQEEVTNEELYQYAIVEETKNLFQKELSAQITGYVEQQDPAIKNRYNELAGGETPANDAEKQFIDKVNNMKSERASEFSDAYKTMIKRVLGADTYKKVRAGLKDSDVRKRYSTIVEEIQSAKEEATASTGSSE